MNYKILKRITLLLLMLALFAACFASCDKDNPTPDESGTEDGSSSVAPTSSKHTVRIFDGDGTELHKETAEEGSLVVYNPEKAGYKFGGYYSDQKLSAPAAFDGKIGSTDTDLYVKWDPIHYTIRFDSGRALGEMKDISATYGEKIKLPQCSFVLMDETFEEWRAVNGEGKTVSFVNGASVHNLTVKEGDVVTLTAVFDNYDSANFKVENGVVLEYTGSATKVRLPETGTIVSADIFKNCESASKIQKLEVPSGYTEIELGAFAPLTALEEIRLPFIGQTPEKNTHFSYIFGAESYKDSYFKFAAEVKYTSLEEVDSDYTHLLVPKTLKKVVITDPLKTISDGAFYHTYSLEKLIILNSGELYEIGESAFEGCINLGYDADLDIANPLNWLTNVETIGDRAFAAYVSEENKEGKSYIFTHLMKLSDMDKVVSIGKEAFYGCVYLNNLNFGEKLKTIGDNAFVNCVSMTSLTLPDSIESIGAYAFTSCASLTEVVLGKGLSKIGSMAFADCEALAQVTLRSESPALISQIPFCNEIEYSYNISGAVTGYTPKFTTLVLYVDNKVLNDYKSAWADYADVLDTKTDDYHFYWGPNSDGSFSAKFEVHGGNVANVTDIDLEFLDTIDWFSDLYNTFRKDIVDNSYTMSIEKVEAPEGLSVGKEEFYRIANPHIVDALGAPTSFVIRVRPERYEKNGNVYYVPVAERADDYFGTTGDKDKSLVVIEKDDWGHYKLLKRENTSAEFTESKPEGALYGNYRLYYILSYTEKMVGMEWYDKDGKLISTEKFMVCDDCLYPCRGEDSLEMCFTDYPYQIILNGQGQALLTLYENSSIVEYLGTYAISGNGKYGEENLTVTLSDMQGKSDKYNGKLVLDGFFDGVYHRCRISVSSNTKFSNTTMYISADKVDYRVCYSADEKTFYAFHDYKSETGNGEAHFVEYYDGEVYSHGVYSKSDDTFTLEVEGYPKTVGYIDDPRGTFHVEGILGNKTYTAYDDWENSSFSMEEDFLGTIITYYKVIMDGYGNALFYDGHDDDFDNWYKGTYYNTHEVIGSDENGDIEVYYFTGVECDKDGKVLKNGKSFSTYFVPDTIIYDDEDEEGNLTYSGALLAVSQTTETQKFTVYDEKGLKFADMSVSPFGIVSMTVYDTVYRNGEYQSTVNETLTSRLSAVAYQTSAGKLMYVVVSDAAGNYMFRISLNENDKWIYEYEGEGEPKEAPSEVKIYPDLNDNTEIAK